MVSVVNGKFRIFLCLVLPLFLLACSRQPVAHPPKSSINSQEKMTYQDYTKPLIKIGVDEVNQKIQAQEDFYLYIGRETCPYCQRFVPKLYQVVKNYQFNIYYLDSENRKDSKLLALRTELGIQTIPHLAKFHHGKQVAYLEKGSQSSMEEIVQFLTP